MPGYAEDGSSDPSVDWVTPFERRTGCRVRITLANSADGVVKQLRKGSYDGGSAPGDALGRLIASRDVAPIDTRAVPGFAGLAPKLERLGSHGGRVYGVPQGWAATLLMWRTDIVRPAPTTWAAVFDTRSPYRGKVMTYDYPIAIADAALYLRSARPRLKIRDVYELDAAQFRAAVELSKRQRQIIATDWSDYVLEEAAFSAGTAVLGPTWQLVVDRLKADEVPVAAVLPKEGGTGWWDAWAVSSHAKHPRCMTRWIEWMLSPRVSAQVAEWYGEAPANRKACAFTRDRRHCARYHATDDAYLARLSLWKAPQADCGDSRGTVCKSWEDWVDAWEEVEKKP